MKFLVGIFLSTACWAQEPVDYSIPTTPFVNPEAVGQILQFRAFSFFYPAYRVQYTADTGPWPPDFNNKSYSTDYTVGTGIEFGLTKGLDFLVYGDYLNSYFFGTVGLGIFGCDRGNLLK